MPNCVSSKRWKLCLVYYIKVSKAVFCFLQTNSHLKKHYLLILILCKHKEMTKNVKILKKTSNVYIKDSPTSTL